MTGAAAAGPVCSVGSLFSGVGGLERDLSDVHALLTSARVSDPATEHPDEDYELAARVLAMAELMRQRMVSAERERDEARADLLRFGGTSRIRAPRAPTSAHARWAPRCRVGAVGRRPVRGRKGGRGETV